MKQFSFIIIFLLTTSFKSYPSIPVDNAQDPIVEAKDVTTIPVIDGKSDDKCWVDAKWQSIDQTWIPWGAVIDVDDFTGKYKVVWSSAQNLLYFVFEITDDIISDKYEKGKSSDIYNFDMIEVFIDENKSGGYHVFDGTADNESSLGKNAENAFAYHIFAKIPESGQSGKSYYVTDIAGKSWSNRIDPDYSDHFPEFIVAREGNITTYEFSLIVYNDTYSLTNEAPARVTLTKDKVMGLSCAANDDDEPDIDPSLTVRDNMIGSVAVEQSKNNNHWKIADDFGTVKLISANTSKEEMKSEKKTFEVGTSSLDHITIRSLKPVIGACNIKIIDLSGQNIYETIITDEKEMIISTNGFPKGVLLVQIEDSANLFTERILIK